MASSRTRPACSAASSGVSANCTPPAFMRPPVSTWDLMTTGPPMSSATAQASSAVLAKPNLVVGMPARRTISRDSYSKKRMRRGPYRGRSKRDSTASRPARDVTSCGCRLELIRRRQLRVLAGQHLGQVDHHPALLPRGVVLHLAVDHVHATPVGDRLDHLLGEPDLLGVRREDLLGDPDLHRVQRPRADAAE